MVEENGEKRDGWWFLFWEYSQQLKRLELLLLLPLHGVVLLVVMVIIISPHELRSNWKWRMGIVSGLDEIENPPTMHKICQPLSFLSSVWLLLLLRPPAHGTQRLVWWTGECEWCWWLLQYNSDSDSEMKLKLFDSPRGHLPHHDAMWTRGRGGGGWWWRRRKSQKNRITQQAIRGFWWCLVLLRYKWYRCLFLFQWEKGSGRRRRRRGSFIIDRFDWRENQLIGH